MILRESYKCRRNFLNKTINNTINKKLTNKSKKTDIKVQMKIPMNNKVKKFHNQTVLKLKLIFK